MGEKLQEVEKQCDRFESDTIYDIRYTKYEIRYSMQYKLTRMNSECVACGCQLITLSGSAPRETILKFKLLEMTFSFQHKL